MKKAGSPRSRALWSLVFVVIAALSVWVIVSQSRTFSFDTFVDYIQRAHGPWLLCAALSMIGFIFFEGEAVICVTRAFGYRSGHGSALVYAASDIYFSAITPSATGGQPACALFMVVDGIPALIATVALLLNLTMYTASILVLGILTLILSPGVFAAFGPLSRGLILLGFVIQVGFMALLLMLLRHNSLMHRLCRGGLHLLCRLRILRHEDRRQAKLDTYMADYAQYARMITGHRRALVRTFLLNLAQRVSVICVPFFVYLASGGPLRTALRVWCVQCCSILGSNSIPIPGAMGVSDYMMLDGFADLLPVQDVVDFELLSRGISFYVCVLLCGAVTLIAYILQQKRDRKP